MEIQTIEGFKAGYVAIIGEPNVGKSTLLNRLLGQKLSIVTPKPQTTRHRILGILSTEAYQVVFFDTPGIINPRYALQKVMMDSMASAVSDADIILVMLDATSPRTAADVLSSEGLRVLSGTTRPLYLVMNKIDLVRNQNLEPVLKRCAQGLPFSATVAISAATGQGTGDLLQMIAAALPVHPPYYPLDIVSEQNERFFVSEIIREKIFLKYREEIPYSTSVDIVEFKEREEGKWFVSADIYVERDSQKGILIGKRGAMLKEIGQLARKDIEEFLQHEVFLELHVKVREQWRDKEEWLRRLGYTR